MSVSLTQQNFLVSMKLINFIKQKLYLFKMKLNWIFFNCFFLNNQSFSKQLELTFIIA